MSETLAKPIVMLGAGGHASVICDVLREQGRTIAAIFAPNAMQDDLSRVFDGISLFTSDDEINQFPSDEYRIVNAIGIVPNSFFRKQLTEKFERAGYQFESVISGACSISKHATVETGCQILAGAIIQAGVTIGRHSIINSNSTIEHDCILGEHCHIAPSATLCGGVTVDEASFIGASSTIIENIKVGRHSIIGAGTVVLRDVPDNSVIYNKQNILIKAI